MQGGVRNKTPIGLSHLKKSIMQPTLVEITRDTLFSEFSWENLPLVPRALRQHLSGKETEEESLFMAFKLRFPIYPSEKCVCVPVFVPLLHHPPPPATFQPGAGGGQWTQSPLCMGWYVSPHPSTHTIQCPFYSLHSAPLPTTSQLHMPGCNWLLAEDSPLMLGLQGILSRFQEPLVQFLVPHFLNPTDAPGPCPCPSYGSWGSLIQPQPYPGCAALLFLG